MKITITYTRAEGQQAAGIKAMLLRLLPGARVHEDVKPPFIRLYLTTRKPGGP